MKTSRHPTRSKNPSAFLDDETATDVEGNDPLDLGRSFVRSATGNARTFGDDAVDIRAFDD